MTDLDEEAVKSRLKEAVQGFIERVRSEHDRIPTRTVVRVDESGTERREAVADPFSVFTEYRIGADKETPILEEAADWLYESGNGFEVNLSDDEGNEIESPNKDQITPWYTNEILMLAGHVMNYSGNFSYSDEAFEAAFNNYFKPKYAELNRYEVIVPLLKFDGPDTIIEINPDIEIELSGGHTGEITHIEISPITPSELSGIFTFESRILTMGSGLERPQFWSHKIKLGIETDAGSHGGLESQALNRVRTALRLFKPETADMGTARRYRKNPNWLDYRENITNINGSSGSRTTPALSGKGYELAEDEVRNFQSFWEEYRHQIDPEKESNIATAIRRFNQTYTKETDEDRLIDCVIAFESTLLKEITQHESYRYRLPTRAALLLDEGSEHDREYIYRFFKKVYDARSRVVHTGQDLQDQRIKEEELRSSEFVNKARDFLRQTILEYIDNQSEGKDVQQTNREIDEAMRKAPFPPNQES